MLTKDIVHSCANEKIAAAALACIGGSFAVRTEVSAAENSLEPGAFVAAIVRDFAKKAQGGDWAKLEMAVRGSDFPLLQGLRHIVETALVGLDTGASASSSKGVGRKPLSISRKLTDLGPTHARCN